MTKFNSLLVVLAITALTFVGCASAPAQTASSSSTQQSYAVQTGHTVMVASAGSCGSYNNLRPGGNQLIPGVDSMKVMPHLKSNGAQLWYNTDNGLWENEGGKFSIFFSSQAAMDAYCRNPFPSPAELRQMTAAEPRCKASIGDQKWLPF